MKFFLLLSVASLAAAFMVPDQQIIAGLTREEVNTEEIPQHLIEEQDNLPPEWGEAAIFSKNFHDFLREQEKEAEYEVEYNEMIKSIRRPRKGHFLFKLGRKLADFFSLSHSQWTPPKCYKDDKNSQAGDNNDMLDYFPHHPHHHPPKEPSETIYQLISKNNHTKIFAHFIDQYDHAKEYLNSTEFNYTVYVPTDCAFKKFKDHPKLPKEYIAKWLAYHVSPGIHRIRSFSSSLQTVPTFLHQENNGTEYQRVRVHRSLFNIKLNFLSKVIKPTSDILATNGVIHTVDHFLVPPFSALDTIDLLAGELSMLNLGLRKTGLVKGFDASYPKTGATIFAPTNKAFKRLGPKINGFLFSKYGEKYLKALLEYHLVVNYTLFTDAYYPSPEGESGTEARSSMAPVQDHVDLPTVLPNHHLGVDIFNFSGYIVAYVNGQHKIGVANLPVKEGVIHLVHSVVIPPKSHHHEDNSNGDTSPFYSKGNENEGEMPLKEFIERLEPFLEES